MNHVPDMSKAAFDTASFHDSVTGDTVVVQRNSPLWAGCRYWFNGIDYGLLPKDFEQLPLTRVAMITLLDMQSCRAPNEFEELTLP